MQLRFVLDYQAKPTHSPPHAVVTAPAAKAESGSTTIIPTTMDQEITPFDFPAAFPGIGGNKFTCWMPHFPFCSISRLLDTCCLAEGTNQLAI